MKSIFYKTTRDEVITRINTLNTSSKAQWGKMTVGQMVRHCILCEEYYFGNIKVKRSLLGRFFGKTALNGMLKDDGATIKKNAPTSPQFRITENILNLEEEKEKWKLLVNNYAAFNKDYFVHWFFGEITKEQLGQFVYKHCHHHLKQFNS